MRVEREMIVAVLLLSAVRAHSFDGEAAQNLPCVPSPENTDPTLSSFRRFWDKKKKPTYQERIGLAKPVISLVRQWSKIREIDGLLYRVIEDVHVSCLWPADYLSAAGPVGIEVHAGKKLNICLERFHGEPVCTWSRGTDPTLTFNGSYSLVLPPLSEADSGEYTLSCETSNGTRSSLAVSLHVMLNLESDWRKDDEASEVILSPGQSLLLRCRHNTYSSGQSKWERDTEGFLFVDLDESKTISVQKASSFYLRASVSSHPLLQHCTWEDPGKNKIATLELHGPHKSGEYKLHLEAGGRRETKTMSLCVADAPEFHCDQDSIVERITCRTTSPGPVTITWKSCSQSNDSAPVCKEIPDTDQSDSGLFCNKMLSRSLSTDLLDGNPFQVCLNNSLGDWCSGERYYRLPEPSRVDPDTGGSMLLKVGSLFLLLALVVVSVVLIYISKKKKSQYQSQLQMIQMVGPNDNDYIYINFKDFQYDQKWEFPRENLELGKELGSGAFGMVVQATAYGIDKPGVSQQVAVKMLKEKHQTVEKEALISELKMLTHIGQHSNIVNLLGACTNSGPTYLIFQYCCYGDLLNYLKNNRERYHKSLTDAFNKDRFSNLYHNLQAKRSSSEFQTPTETYVPMYPSTIRGQENLALLSLNSIPMDSAEGMYEESEEQRDEVQLLTYNDLLSFAYQVAQGMEFLSSMNCIHRDLAARNVLVTKGRLVKICDFGLARDIDNDSNYVVRGNVRLPVKWMAPESIFQGMYTMKSDVWAYGILLWEIFSLGITPYPGVKVDNSFYSMIERGFKMECPYYASESVYGMMCRCWALEPCDRPPFSKLVTFMDEQLTDMEEKLYHNAPDQDSGDWVYQNAPAILDISALTKEENQTQSNQYCLAHATEDMMTTTSGSDAGTSDDKYVKSPGTGSE
ncbi:receptor-type tyrosine-protein kinase FLT3-like [Diretmus argenteus]